MPRRSRNYFNGIHLNVNRKQFYQTVFIVMDCLEEEKLCMRLSHCVDETTSKYFQTTSFFVVVDVGCI